ncbi:MAG: isoprenylcysteine carboxylmethyltransferase family protein [Candidatus Competibacteraceae bacterium]
MNSIRYYLALLLVISLPAMLLFWLLIHPFIPTWRRLGPVWTYSLVGTLVMLMLFGLFQARTLLLTVEFGSHALLWLLGSGCLAMAVYLRRLIHDARLTVWVLVGLPELAPDRHPQKLLTTGLYARLRHPRYVQVALALLGYALIANYLAAYLVFAAWLILMYPLVVLEERELRQRFGNAYEAYCRQVPRFIPRLRIGPC